MSSRTNPKFAQKELNKFMEIRNLQSSMINAYKKTAAGVSPKKTQTAAKTEKTDRVEFDFGRYLETAKTEAASAADASASPARLAALAEKYSGDNCPVSAEDVAAAILG